MSFLVIWIRDGQVEAVRAFKTEKQAINAAYAWASDEDNFDTGDALVWNLKSNRPIDSFSSTE